MENHQFHFLIYKIIHKYLCIKKQENRVQGISHIAIENVIGLVFSQSHIFKKCNKIR